MKIQAIFYDPPRAERATSAGPASAPRFVLPAAPGAAFLAGPAHRPPPRALPSAVQGGRGLPRWGGGAGHHGGIAPVPGRSAPPAPVTGWSPAVARSSWNCPLTWDPSTCTLESHNCLQSGAFWEPGDPPWEGAGGLRRPWESGQRPTTAFTPHQQRPPGGAPWRGVTIAPFLLPEACPSSSWSPPCEGKRADGPASGAGGGDSPSWAAQAT